MSASQALQDAAARVRGEAPGANGPRSRRPAAGRPYRQAWTESPQRVAGHLRRPLWRCGDDLARVGEVLPLLAPLLTALGAVIGGMVQGPRRIPHQADRDPLRPRSPAGGPGVISRPVQGWPIPANTSRRVVCVHTCTCAPSHTRPLTGTFPLGGVYIHRVSTKGWAAVASPLAREGERMSDHTDTLLNLSSPQRRGAPRLHPCRHQRPNGASAHAGRPPGRRRGGPRGTAWA